MLKTQRSKSRSAADVSSASQASNKPQRFVAKLRRLLSLDRNKYLLSRLSQMLELGSMQQMGPPTKELPENLFLLAQRLAIEHTVMSMVDATSLFLGQQFSDASPMPSRGRPNAVHKAPSELGGGGGTGASASASGTNNMGIETPKPAAGPVLSPASQRIGGETVHKNSQRSLLDLFIERFVSGRMDKEECGRWCQNIAADLVARVPAPRLQLQLRRDVALYGQRKDYTWRPYEVGGGDSGSETTSRDIQNHASHAGSNSSGPSNSMLCQRNRPREDVCQGTTSDSVCELFVVFHAALQATAVQARRSGTTPAGAAQTAFVPVQTQLQAAHQSVQEALACIYLDARLHGALSLLHCHAALNAQSLEFVHFGPNCIVLHDEPRHQFAQRLTAVCSASIVCFRGRWPSHQHSQERY
eukprot:INCI17187.4.p1 GENE.INCI17187.4~~INCI17187.4.p1  ORF type:complete len:414 (-),score=47.17 INCI17187.4:200-1441(-)